MTKMSGYTLLEVMVALIIIGISITAVTGALSTAKGLSARSDYAVESVRILKNILNNPELMKQIMENRNFKKVLDDEDGWICTAETTPLVIDSSELIWDNSDIGSTSGFKRRDGTALRRKDSRTTKNMKKSVVGEEVEIPQMVNVVLCVSQTNQLIQKEYCITRWKREEALVSTQFMTKPNNSETKKSNNSEAKNR